MTRSWRDMAQEFLFFLGLLALVYAMMLNAGVINTKEVRLSPELQRKKTFIAVRSPEGRQSLTL